MNKGGIVYKGSEADKKYRSDYLKNNSKLYGIRLFFVKDKEMIEHLEKNKPVNSYLKKLVREDMEK